MLAPKKRKTDTGFPTWSIRYTDLCHSNIWNTICSKYGESIGVRTFFNVSDFIPFVMQVLIAFGLSYQFHLVMWVITYFKIAGPNF
jgi:hypothetical protein